MQISNDVFADRQNSSQFLLKVCVESLSQCRWHISMSQVAELVSVKVAAKSLLICRRSVLSPRSHTAAPFSYCLPPDTLIDVFMVPCLQLRKSDNKIEMTNTVEMWAFQFALGHVAWLDPSECLCLVLVQIFTFRTRTVRRMGGGNSTVGWRKAHADRLDNVSERESRRVWVWHV